MGTLVVAEGEVKESRDAVVTYGHFTTIHPGHIRYLQNARSQGKELIIALIGDIEEKGESKYAYSQQERSKSLKMLDIADKIVLLKTEDLMPLIDKVKPRILILGGELQKAKKLEAAINLVKKNNGEVKFDAGDVHYASADLLTSKQSDIAQKRINELRLACERQNILAKSLKENTEKWKSTKLLIVGDIILDEYAACEPLGISAEAPVIVVKELAKREFIGAAGIVAAHIDALGAKCKLISVIGEDENGKKLGQILSNKNIDAVLVEDSERPTTYKKRYMVENQKLFRVSKLEERKIEKSIEDRIIKEIREEADQINGIVIADFVYGVVTERILKAVKDISEKYNVKVFGDLQCSSQVGKITKMKGFDLLCPNERELRMAYQDIDNGIESLGQRLIKESKCKNLLIKLGGEGLIAYQNSGNSQLRQAFPALSAAPLDVAGAGDSVLAVMATGLSSGDPLMETAVLATCMASLAVTRMGNTPIDVEELCETMERIIK